MMPLLLNSAVSTLHSVVTASRNMRYLQDSQVTAGEPSTTSCPSVVLCQFK